MGSIVLYRRRKALTSRVVGRGAIAAPLLLVVGVLLLTEVAVTLVWQEPVTASSGRREQDVSERLRATSRPRSRRRPDLLRGGVTTAERCCAAGTNVRRRPASRSAGSTSRGWT